MPLFNKLLQESYYTAPQSKEDNFYEGITNLSHLPFLNKAMQPLWVVHCANFQVKRSKEERRRKKTGNKERKTWCWGIGK